MKNNSKKENINILVLCIILATSWFCIGYVFGDKYGNKQGYDYGYAKGYYEGTCESLYSKTLK